LLSAIIILPLPNVILGNVPFADYLLDIASTILFFVGSVAALIFLYNSIPYHSSLRRTIDSTLICIPVLGKTLLYLALSRYCSAFSMLFSAGVPILTAAEKAAETTGNTAVSSMLRGATEAAAAGRPMHTGFSSHLPVEFIAAWQTGEESGSLDNTALHLASQITERAEFRSQQLAIWLPRIVYFIAVGITAYMILKYATGIRAM
jgi:type IV pilus assembly protein PilC